MSYIQISKRQARTRFNRDESIIICPSKVMPGGLWDLAYHLSPAIIREWKLRAKWYNPKEETINQTAWKLMFNNWAFYNTNDEVGNKCHFYVEGSSHVSIVQGHSR